MIIPYSPENSLSHYSRYYNEQAGNGFSVFRGSSSQKGHGIGSFLGGLVKGALPLLKSGAKSVGQELLRTGVGIAKDAISGRNLRESATENFREAGSNLFNQLTTSLSNPKPQREARSLRKRKRRAVPNNKKAKKSKKATSLFQNVDVATR